MTSDKNVKVVSITKEKPGPQEAAGGLLEQMKKLYDGVARRAYELFETRGGEPGKHLQDWFSAETELLGMVEGELREKPDRMEAQFSAPGFRPEEIEVSVEPRCLVVRGKTVRRSQWTAKEGSGTAKSEEQFLRRYDLPAEVDPDKVTATLTQGKLTVALPRKAIAVPVREKAKAA